MSSPAKNVAAESALSVMGELLFLMHGNLLTARSRPVNPRSIQQLCAGLSLLSNDETLPAEFRALCACLRDDWAQMPAPEKSSYRAEMQLCAA